MALLGQNELKWLFEVASMFVIDKKSTGILQYLSAIADQQSSGANRYFIVWNACGLWSTS